MTNVYHVFVNKNSASNRDKRCLPEHNSAKSKTHFYLLYYCFFCFFTIHISHERAPSFIWTTWTEAKSVKKLFANLLPHGAGFELASLHASDNLCPNHFTTPVIVLNKQKIIISSQITKCGLLLYIYQMLLFGLNFQQTFTAYVCAYCNVLIKEIAINIQYCIFNQRYFNYSFYV